MSGPPLTRLIDRFLAQAAGVTVATGITGPVVSYLVARLAAAAPEGAPPLIVVCRDEARAEQLASEVEVFHRPLVGLSGDPLAPPVAQILPEVDGSPYSDLAPDRRSIMERLAVLLRLLHGFSAPVVATSVKALLRLTIVPAEFDARCDLVGVGQEIDREALAASLVAAGYQPMPVVEDPGTFCVRGNVVDYFPPVHRYPVRLELTGDEITSLRHYDPETQRTLRTLEQAYVHPVRETLITRGARPREKLLAAADAAQYPSSRTRYVLDQIEQRIDFFGAESLLSVFHERLAPVWEYVPAGARWVLEEPDALAGAAAAEWDELGVAYAERLGHQLLAVPPADLFAAPDAVAAHLETRLRLELRALLDEDGAAAALRVESQGHAELAGAVHRLQAERGQEVLTPLADALRARLADGLPTVVVSPDEHSGERLADLLAHHGVAASVRRPAEGYAVPGAGATGEVEIRLGELSAGFTLPLPDPAVFAEEELFGVKTRRARRTAQGRPNLGDLGELGIGDYIVHTVHGVGQYQGLRREEVRGVAGDFMIITYQGGDKLFLPVHRFQEVHRYLASESHPPRLDRMGGATWQLHRRKVSDQVRHLAEELLKLYAQRAALPGHAFPEPDELYRAFEATFPFTETPDQLQAIDAVVGDLTSERPMDRLVCGDVGFGKTEVALRAAVLAVLGGKQVALLAPTTVLVEQHLHTFTERLRAFPVRVAALSRFRPPGVQRRILQALAAGDVDVVIGTHRLLSADVRFAKLGLLIVDEEQRFGVAHKERLKQLRTQVDVLTLTATPIPRTLNLAMLGIRDLSLIATAPVDRQAVRTFVSATSPQVVQDAVRREIARGGQVFFVVPYIAGVAPPADPEQGGGGAPRRKVSGPPARNPGVRGSLAFWTEEVRRLVPEARVAEVHGQLDARTMERVMSEFVAGHHDVLVSTSIIESGLDIPRANTLIVADADRFGLAQLYQIRGRVGRGKLRAFCILMVPSLSAITAEARQRLEALQRFSTLGAGFQLASTDLEIRGTGDLLGGKQSGNIASVGFEEYMRIMEEAIAELRGEPLQAESDPDLTSDVPSFIPDDHVSDPGMRLHFYRRFASLGSEGEADALLAELSDRFGPCPDEVHKLAGLMVLKAIARRLRARGVDLSGRRLTLALDERTPLAPAVVRDLILARGSLYTLTPDLRLVRRLERTGDLERLLEAKKALHELARHVREDAG